MSLLLFFSLPHWYVTFDVTITTSASAFSFRSCNILRFQFNIFVFIAHAHWNVTVNVFETLSALTFFPFTLSSSCSFCVFVSEFFVIHFSIIASTYLCYLRDPFAHVLITICPSTDTCLVDLFILICTSGTLCLV